MCFVLHCFLFFKKDRVYVYALFHKNKTFLLGRLALICIKCLMKLTYSKPILHEHSNKKRPPSTVCDEMCFHGRSRKTIISLQHLVRSVVSKLGAVNFRDFRRYFGKFSITDIKVKQKQKKTRSHPV